MARIINGSKVTQVTQHFGLELTPGSVVLCEDEEDAVAYERVLGGRLLIREEMQTENGGMYETDWAEL